ncbi:MAG: phosphodiester glycosidase family protein [Bacteroidales bacterium]|nr:phosphodiester glycosidase family protein [Bacteroidales bacterium]MDD4713153.1 phosphodiester glycosidase family protein [Bacteroidales bacterium]
MNKLYSIIFIFISVLFVQAQTLPIDGVNYTVDTLENHQVGPGTQYVSLRLTAPAKRLDVYFLKADLKDPHIEIRTALGKDSIYTGEAPSALAKRISSDGNFYFAGTNGDFYATSGYVGYPVSGNMVNGEIARIPGPRNVFTIDDQKIPDIGIMSYNGSIQFGASNWAINSVNHLRGENELVLFNRHNGKYTHTNEYGTEVLIELLDGYNWGSNKTLKAKVVNIRKGVGNMAIPKGKAVLSGHGTAAEQLNLLSVNDEIDLRLNLTVNANSVSNFTQMTGGDNYKTMLQNGVVEQTSVWSELHPRTGLGYSQNKDTVIFCVVDGRGLSIGATTKQLAILMKSAGAYTAFNMDGGGSSAMYVSEYGGPVNRTSDGNERAVANSVFIVSTAPTDNQISIIKPYRSSISLPEYGEHIPQFYGYNQYGVLLNSDVQGVVLTCPETLGTIYGNKFIANGNTPGNITATYNGNVTASITVNLLPVSNLRIRLDSVMVDNRSDYPIEVIATTAGGESLISPAALNWSVSNPEICKIEEGVVKALKNGKTTVTGQINSVTDELQINVAIPSDPTMIGDSLKSSSWSLNASSFLNAQLNQTNLPINWNHGSAVNFVHTAGRSPFIKLINQRAFFGMPDTIKILMNIGDMAISRAIIYLKANNGTSTISYEINSFEQNKDFTLNIPLNQLFNATDRAIYPIWFDNVNFYINTSGMTEAKAYTLAVKDVLLVFKDFVISGLSPVKSTNFSIYPNPVTNQTLYLQPKENNSQVLRTEIYSLTGQLLIRHQQGIYQGGVVSVPVKKLSSGTYLLKVYEDEHFSVAKFIIE